MTTYQDPPLQSRRAVREGERTEAQPSSFPTQGRPLPSAGEPLSYVTQNRPPLPAYDQAAPRGRRVAEPEATAEETDAQPQPPSGFRPRDYSPEARTAPPAWSPEHDRESGMVEYHTQARADVVAPPSAAEPPVAAPPSETPAPAAERPVTPPAPASSLAASLASEPSEQTFTRRELRALREAHGIVPADTSVTPAVPVPQPEAPAPAATPFPFSAPAVGDEQHETRRGRRAAESQPEAPALAAPAVAEPVVAEPVLAERDAEPALVEPPRGAAAPVPPAPAEPVWVETPPVASVSVDPVSPDPAPVAADPGPAPVPAFAAPAPVVPLDPPSEPEPRAVVLPPEPAAYAPPSVPTPVEPAPVAPRAAAEPPAPAPAAPVTGERPVGHWTTQSDLDERTQVNESTVSRRVGSGALTTNALVLPSLPGHDMSTGETMLTGTVSLPASLAETGAHSAIDESDIDHLLDPGDHQLVHTDSVPISAFKAVSSHSGNRQQLIANGKPNRGNRALTALIVAASGMVVVVVTLLVVAVINGGI